MRSPALIGAGGVGGRASEEETDSASLKLPIIFPLALDPEQPDKSLHAIWAATATEIELSPSQLAMLPMQPLSEAPLLSLSHAQIQFLQDSLSQPTSLAFPSVGALGKPT